MKHLVKILFISLFSLTAIAALFATGQKEETGPRKLTVYAYDSFVSEWGPGPVISEEFEEEYGIPVNMVSAGDAGQVLSRVILEKNDPQASVIIGIDNNLLPRAREEGVLSPYKPDGAEKIDQDYILDDDFLVTPYDYGFFSIIYDSQRIDNPPTSLEDLTAESYEDSLILMDPRTSTPGLGFVLWTYTVYGEDYADYWERLKPSILTVTEGWDAGYGLFTSGEAPFVLSYTTSPAYHVEYEDSTRFQAAIFPEGHYMQIEGLGIVNGAPNRSAARKFIDFMISEEAQEEIPLTNWMYPVHPDVQLPDSYEYAPIPDNKLMLDSSTLQKKEGEILETWLEILGAR